ncbi:teicoplanin resistance protein VanZ [Desulfopila sp. IMCC35006]|uniref:VanZ family protein n=1 Tax=Desulfopila sp. IMCC35006 TaxID=2569542 RepID=UPI0010AB5C76|nr:VanZ family protein [Desulfopila sp. IMCC35006]TKB28178.1 teicoplanin resistance protein VanZ [Desulfopila sp. IMCC35006]
MDGKAAAALRMVPAIFTMGTIFYLSHQTGDRLPLPALPGLDKLAHLAAYGLLAATVLFAVSARQKSTRPLRVIILTVCFCLLYGISDEFHQSFIPGRTASVFDLMADGGGAVVVCGLWRKWRLRIASSTAFLQGH